jgi:signal transduction histidine kinase
MARKKVFDSIQVRFILVSISLSLMTVLGAGGILIWQLRWHLLIKYSQKHIEKVDNFHRDIEIYQKEFPAKQVIDQAIQNNATYTHFIRVTNSRGEILGVSEHPPPVFPDYPPIHPYFVSLQGRTYIRCGQPLELPGVSARVETVSDVTRTAQIYQNFLKTLCLAGTGSVVIAGSLGWIATRVSLSPLRKISRVTQRISLQTLAEVRLMLEDFPVELKQLTETLNEMLNRLARSWVREKELLSTISRELHSPTIIVQHGLENTLSRPDNLTSLQIEGLGVALEESRRVSRMLDDLQDITRIESGIYHLQMEPICLRSLFQEIYAMAQRLGSTRVILDCPDTKVMVRADRDRLKQVLLNFITNAIRYSDPEAPITLRIAQAETRVLLQVQDQGIGIPKEAQQQIFERFYSFSVARSRSQGGVGLGLAISKMLVESMGGEILLESTPGVGSTFSVALPLLF